MESTVLGSQHDSCAIREFAERGAGAAEDVPHGFLLDGAAFPHGILHVAPGDGTAAAGEDRRDHNFTVPQIRSVRNARDAEDLDHHLRCSAFGVGWPLAGIERQHRAFVADRLSVGIASVDMRHRDVRVDNVANFARRAVAHRVHRACIWKVARSSVEQINKARCGRREIEFRLLASGWLLLGRLTAHRLGRRRLSACERNIVYFDGEVAQFLEHVVDRIGCVDRQTCGHERDAERFDACRAVGRELDATSSFDRITDADDCDAGSSR